MKNFVAILALPLFLAACSATGARFADTLFSKPAPADRARIVFYRESDANFRAATVAIDGAIVGAVDHYGFIAADIAPGDRELSAWVRYVPVGEFVVRMTVGAGETYYVRVSHRSVRMLYPLLGAAGGLVALADRKGEFQMEAVPAADALRALQELKQSD
ncbi:MAG TPA: DUF2846 domain-containing protein [Candidatus Binatia bacterium]|jgi:hypothetical protein